MLAVAICFVETSVDTICKLCLQYYTNIKIFKFSIDNKFYSDMITYKQTNERDDYVLFYGCNDFHLCVKHIHNVLHCVYVN